MKGTNQKLKLLYLKEILEEETDNEHGIGMPRICELLEQKGVSAERKAIYRDLELLATEYGLPIEHEPGGRLYRLAEHPFEFADLKLMMDTIASSKTLTEKKSLDLINKLKTLCSKHERETLFHQIIVTDRAKTQNNSVHYNIDTINKAIAKKKCIKFRYYYYGIDKRKIYSFGGRSYLQVPYAMIYVDNNYYLLCFDLRGRKKHFRIDRMESVRMILSMNYSEDRYSSKVDIANYTKYTFSMYGNGDLIDVTMRFDKSLASMVLDRFGHDTLLIQEDKTHFKVTQPIAVSPQFYSWIVGLGEKAEILEPEEVRMGIRKHLEKVLSHYQSKK